MPSATAETPPSPLQQAFAEAARESRVPEPLLLAVSYQLTRWDEHGSEPSAGGGYGLMHLTDLSADQVREEAGQGLDDRVNEAAIAADESLHRLPAAAGLVGVDADRIREDSAFNIRAGAALLAEKARELGNGTLPSDLAGWYPAVAWYSGSPQPSGATAFADDVYESLRAGVSRINNQGQRVTLAPSSVPAVKAKSQRLTGLSADPPSEPTTPTPECPSVLDCRFVPAAYQWINRADPNDYGNYDPADRPRDGNNIRYIVIHDTEGSYNGTIAAAQNPRTYVASHYVIRSSDGEVTQMLRTKDIGWHAANWNINTQSIGIEHEAFARDGATWYTEAMYRSSARLVKYLAKKYGIPLDRTHIIGHDEIERERPATVSRAHWDPGPYWDWERYMKLLGAPVTTQSGKVRAGDIVTIKPRFATNLQALPSCSPTPCKDLPAQGTNFLYLRTEPRADAPLINDPALQPTGEPGRPHAEDWGNKAAAGRQYVVAEVQGRWVAIWFAGKKAWIADTDRTRVKLSGVGQKITPADGLESIPVYGKAFPEAGEYPAEVTPNVGVPLQYTIGKGQVYVAGEEVQANNYYARFDEANVPLNHTLLMGKQKYLRVSLNHRWAWAKLSDVKFVI